MDSAGSRPDDQLTRDVPSHVHCLPRSYIPLVGLSAGAILYGFAIKLKGHRSNWNGGKYWYYETLERLHQLRWPYLSPSTIGEATIKLEEEGLLLRNRLNKKSYDKTVSYSMDNEIRKKVLGDQQILFDTRVAEKTEIIDGILFHNIQYHIFELKKKHPNATEELYHKLNKKRFARDIGVDRSTAKRAVNRLLENNFILESTDRKGYLISDNPIFPGTEAQMRGADCVESPQKRGGSFPEMSGSLLEISGSKSEKSGSFPDNNTQYETNQKPIRNQFEKNEGVELKLNIEEITYLSNESESKINSKSLDRDNSWSSSKEIKSSKSAQNASFDDCPLPVHSAKSLGTRSRLSVAAMGDLKAGDLQVLKEGIFNSLIHFIDNSISTEERLEILEKGNSDFIIKLLGDRLSSFTLSALDELFQLSKISSKQKLESIFIALIESIVYSIERDSIHRYPLLSYLNFPDFTFLDVFMKLSECLESNIDVSANLKFDIFKNRVEERNLSGWLVKKNGFGTTNFDREYRNDCVKVEKSCRRDFVRFFELNSEFSAESMFQIQIDCVFAASVDEQEDGFDKYYHCRRAVDSLYLVRKLEKVLAELGLKEHFPDIVFENGQNLD